MRNVALILCLGIVGCGNGSSTDSTGSGGTGGSNAQQTSSPVAQSSSTNASASHGGSSVAGTGGSAPSNDSKCSNSGLAICEGFEGAATNGFPMGWGARGDEWGDGEIAVSAADSKRGGHSLRVHGGSTGQRFMDYKGDLGNLAKTHYGRVFLKVTSPAPVPQSGVLHGDFIEGLGAHPGGGTNNVRWGTVENTQAKFQWIYNVQPSQGENEFGEGTSYDYTWAGNWQCIEWYYDQPSQTGTLWIDSTQIPIVPGTSHSAEIPVFTSLGVGFANYQDAGSGFEVFFDELAYDPARIGCDK